MGAGSSDLEVIIRLRRDGHIPDRPAIITATSNPAIKANDNLKRSWE